MEKSYDFSGWATRNNIKCSDGRTILKDAFKHNDGQTVPLVWNHQHNDPLNVLGHAVLENRNEGVYAYCAFNETESGQSAKLLVEHGDIQSLSIYANQLKQSGGNVLHGAIREVSLVLAGANPEAYIDNIIRHGEEFDDEAIIFTGEGISLYHTDDVIEKNVETIEEGEKQMEKSLHHAEEIDEIQHAEEKEETVADVFNTLTDKQKTVVYALIGQALEDAGVNIDDEKDNSEGGNTAMKHNVFDQEEIVNDNVLSHSDMEAIFSSAKRYGSLKDATLAHVDGDIEYSPNTAAGAERYGIDAADNWLFPDARLLNTPPTFIQRDMGWVSKVMTGVHRTPFSRIKSLFADITENDARALGYIKGKMKKEEFFTLVKRTTTPTTVYKKQKMDRDDVIDITDFDVVSWLKSEMRMMLDEELARAFLIGDGRETSSDDHINHQHIRPIWTDDDLFTIKRVIEVTADMTEDDTAKLFIRNAIKARKDYKGSGEPILFTSEDLLTDMLLLEDKMGRVIYDSVEKLKNALRVKEIVTVPVMENLKPRNDSGVEKHLMGIIVNLKDYNVGADKGGAVNMFDDFDIDYNQQKYLIETRCSGALVKPYSAIAIEKVNAVAAG